MVELNGDLLVEPRSHMILNIGMRIAERKKQLVADYLYWCLVCKLTVQALRWGMRRHDAMNLPC